MSDDLDTEMQQIVKGLASDPSQRSRPSSFRDDNDRPITKREAREIIEAIRGIRTYDGAETNKHLAETNVHLKWIVRYLLAGYLLVIALIAFFILLAIRR
jgi:hypothetical protein